MNIENTIKIFQKFLKNMIFESGIIIKIDGNHRSDIRQNFKVFTSAYLYTLDIPECIAKMKGGRARKNPVFNSLNCLFKTYSLSEYIRIGKKFRLRDVMLSN
jgi:hypothetical protein